LDSIKFGSFFWKVIKTEDEGGYMKRVAENLIAKGFNAKALKGGWREWSEAKYPVEKK
jgi:rhodanese-related sulfurtransferase